MSTKRRFQTGCKQAHRPDRRFAFAGALIGALALLATPAGAVPTQSGGPLPKLRPLTEAPGTYEYAQFGGLSPEQEARIGAEEHPKILQAYGGAYESDTVGGYIAVIAGRLIRNSDTPNAPFRVTVLNSPVVNAFALPGGYVYITRGLMALANNEEEVAGVLGHEIGHVTARHAAQRVSRAQTTGILGTLGTIGALILGGETAGRIAQDLFGIGGQLYLLSYSRGQEYEADQIGVRYLARTGYDPMGMASFLQQMDRHNALQARLRGQEYNSAGGDYLSTHPNTRERVQRAITEANLQGSVQGSQNWRVDPFLDAIDGMIFGDAPEQGFVRGRTFSHPTLRFTFEVPQGYRMQNSASEIVIAGPSNAVARFDGDGFSARGNMSGYLTQRWAPDLGVRLSQVQSYTINGMPAATGTAQVNYQNRSTDLRVVAVQFESDQIYRFLILTPRSETRRLNPGLQAMTESLRRLSSSEASRLRPHRIDVVRVRSGDTVASLSRRMVVEEQPEFWFRTLNGLDSNEQLRVGERVKVIVE